MCVSVSGKGQSPCSTSGQFVVFIRPEQKSGLVFVPVATLTLGCRLPLLRGSGCGVRSAVFHHVTHVLACLQILLVNFVSFCSRWADRLRRARVHVYCRHPFPTAISSRTTLTTAMVCRRSSPRFFYVGKDSGRCFERNFRSNRRPFHATAVALY